ncbi:MAG: hypothetical protein JXB29_11550 [Sedimentisphaerales bacterium]|nr:hypothetical protein [Sedimentisphaerales bacterium]
MKLGKISLVVFITVLIWVWADLELDEELSDKPAVVIIDKSSTPSLWVSLNEDKSDEFDIRVTLSGPHGAVSETNRKLRTGERLEFDFDASAENMKEPGTYPLALLGFLRKDKHIRRSGLKVKSCEPEQLLVNVVALEKKTLTIRCLGEDQISIEPDIIDPPQVDALVPEYWGFEKLAAYVELRRSEIDQARSEPVVKKPYVVFSEGQTREIPTVVRIKMPPEEDPRKPYTIKNARLGVIFSPLLKGYDVVLENEPQVMGPIAIRATPAAQQVYENTTYQVLLEIYDSDRNPESTEFIRRTLVYNFPEDLVRSGQIALDQQPVEARFKLKPLSP